MRSSSTTSPTASLPTAASITEKLAPVVDARAGSDPRRNLDTLPVATVTSLPPGRAKVELAPPSSKPANTAGGGRWEGRSRPGGRSPGGGGTASGQSSSRASPQAFAPGGRRHESASASGSASAGGAGPASPGRECSSSSQRRQAGSREVAPLMACMYCAGWYSMYLAPGKAARHYSSYSRSMHTAAEDGFAGRSY